MIYKWKFFSEIFYLLSRKNCSPGKTEDGRGSVCKFEHRGKGIDSHLGVCKCKWIRELIPMLH